jgi:hypothetical protein
VRCWGHNGGRYLGDDDRPHDARELAGLDGVAIFALGDRAACAALRGGAETRCWKGTGTEGRAVNQPGAPWTVGGLPTIVRLALGEKHGYAVTEAGDLRRFALEEGAPVEPPMLSGVRALAAWRHTCALDGAGAVWCWGESEHGQCGVLEKEVAAPRRVKLPGAAKVIAVGLHASWALLEDGTVAWWGSGRAVTGDWKDQPEPATFALPEPAVELVGGAQFACARTASKRVLCWGTADEAVFGDESRSPWLRPPQAVAGLEGIEQVVADAWGICARGPGDRVVCWGRL